MAFYNLLPHQLINVSERLILRQLLPDDATELFALVDGSRQSLQQWLPWAYDTKSVSDSTEFIQSTLDNRAGGTTYAYGIMFDDTLVGHISLMHLRDDEPVEIGYWLSDHMTKQGIMTTAVIALGNFGFDILDVSKIIIKADARNTASNRVAEKAGYRLMRCVETTQAKQTNIWQLDARI